ncbi:hypothetical protein I3843_07G025000 [Carya illinoinensis]|uniref:Uncharacterized protein n=1 Tax=Carya illinoinensis TaxID=32201 RepID=A0A8T1PU46_CARIL|nr:ribonuclease S-7-like isoform X2 [Carya illinoinensis]KAG6646685.1 hypothetical protein CIPAW_07G025200 [Carya illinoinensis]KAG6702281.1 hypothetical protein I3842_07G026200 [Carya illinoinensis]KAG7969306.1 hypothetical protein I3843_07G025000 [Carya illinoinensis]
MTTGLLASCLVSAIGVYFYYLLQDGPFEYFYLTLRWPASVCSGVNCSEVPGNFTIHGLWAQTKNHKQYDCSGKDFDYEKLANDTALMAEMNKIWPSLSEVPDQNRDLWKHEWNKHGSCTFESQRQNEYFYKTCGMCNQARLLKIFEAKDITPGNKSYFLRDYIDAIQTSSEIGKKPGPFTCKWKKSGPKRLVEVKLCTDKEVTKFMDCTAPEEEAPTCGKVEESIPIAFPSNNKDDDEVAVL